MYNLENLLVQYATFNWQNLFIDLNSNLSFLFILCFIFVLIFITRWILDSKSLITLSSTYTQTDVCYPEFKESKSKITESGDVLLESILNHKFTRNHIFNSWIINFNEFKFSQIISKNCRIEEFNENYSDPFKISQIRIIENKELITFTFRMKCARLFLVLQLMYEEKRIRQAHLDMTDIELSALVMIRFTENGLLLKLFPDCVCDMSCDLIVDGISDSEREMSLAEFKRDFKLIMMQTLEMEWKSSPAQDNEASESDRQCQLGGSPINDAASGDIETSRSVSMEIAESVDENRVLLEMADCDNSKSESGHVVDVHGKEMMSHISLFTMDSNDCYEPGEESPFHDRVSSKLIGRTLVVGLIKVVEVQELKNPLKNGYCVLELDEPYQRHVSHLISLTDYPIWNQHFIFSLNSNSQRLTVELFHASKKCQNPFSLGVSIIPISLIIVDPSENYFPINNNQIGSRKSWRCDVIPGAADSKIPAFLIEFQIMRNVHDLTKPAVDPPSDISSNTSGPSLQLEKIVKTSDKFELNPENGHKMQTIPEAQTPDNTLTKIRSAEENKIFLREKTNNENGRSKSVIRRIRHRFSRLSVPWISEKSKSDDCLDQIADENETQIAHNSEVPVQPPAELFITNSNNKPKFFSKISDVDLRNSRSLSISLKKVFNIPSKKQSDKYKEKSLEQLFKDMDPKLFDTISNEGFNRIMNSK